MFVCVHVCAHARMLILYTAQVTDPNSRVHCNAIAWHPDVATQMVTASGDDRSPVVQV